MAGESAQREFERLRDKRRAFIRDHILILLGVTVALAAVLGVAAERFFDAWWLGAAFGVIVVAGKLAPSQRQTAYGRGAEGERIVGAALDRLASGSTVVLHDRLIPGSRANVDHILIARSGVWTVDAKRYKGRIEARARGRELWVNGRDRSKLLDQSDRQVAVLREVLAEAGRSDVPVRGVLCFTGVEWPWLFPPREVRGVRVSSPKGLTDLLAKDRPVADPRSVARIVESALKPAVADAIEKQSEPVARTVVDSKPPAPESARDEFFATPVKQPSSPVGPACSCGATMVERKRRKDGQRFWGCASFPACRRTRPIG